MRRAILAPVAAAVLGVVLLFGGYMGAYYGMLHHRDFSKTPVTPYASRPVYRVRGIAAFLWPANQIDRCLRPAYWHEPPWPRDS
jgi:hypothetical protein